MRTFVRILTTIVVLIVFTTAAGLRASDTRRVTSQEPILLSDIEAFPDFDSPLGITTPVGYDSERFVWDALETALTAYEFGIEDDAFAPSLDFLDDTFEVAFDDTPALLVDQVLQTIAPAQAPLLATVFETTEPVVVTGRTPTSTRASLRPPVFQAAAVTPDLFTIAPRRATYEEVVISRFQNTAFAAPVPVPAALPMLAAALCVFGLIRRRT